MRKTVRKWFWVWDFDKEEQWLNEMAAKGLALVGTGFCRYDFEECVPGEYQVRLELLENQLQDAESQQYIRFLEETGVEQVGNYFRWVYFRKKTADGAFDPVLIKNEFEEGTGHHSIIRYKGEYYAIYHGRDYIASTSTEYEERRTARVCKLTVSDGKITAERFEDHL